MTTTRTSITDLNARAAAYSGTEPVGATFSPPISLSLSRVPQSQNLDPRTQTVLNKKITCVTYDKTNTSSVSTISEGHVIVPTFTPTEISGGVSITKKFVIKLGSTDYALKFHLPQGGENSMYITFAKKDTSYQDGYKDYVSAIPPAFVDALKAWCESSYNSTVTRSFSAAEMLRKRRLTFSYMGRLTTDPNQSGKFYVEIVYQTSLISTDTVETTGTRLR